MRTSFLLALTIVLLSPRAGQAQSPWPVPATISDSGPVTKTGTIRIGAENVNYRAAVDETLVHAPKGRTGGVMITTSFVRTDVSDVAHRPILFAFHGGPGSASAEWNVQALGPRILHDGHFIDNERSILNDFDLVFIDPIGTGYSTILPAESTSAFWSTTADAQSVIQFIGSWVKAHGRETSPKYVLGESYGTTRAAAIAEMGKDLQLDGIVLVSNVGMPDDPDLPFVMSFPTFATTAAYHGKAARAGRTTKAIFDEAAVFAEARLLPALVQGNRLPDAQKRALASEMSRRIGLPAQTILSDNLRVDTDTFLFSIVGPDKRTGLLDTRVTGDVKTFTKRFGPYADPGYGLELGTPTGIYAAGIDQQLPNVMEPYMRDELGYRTHRPYQLLNLDLLFTFNHEGGDGAAILRAAEAMKEQPKLRLLVVAGYYDLTTPAEVARYDVAHVGDVRDRVRLEYMESGHSVAHGDANVSHIGTLLRSFANVPTATRKAETRKP